MSFLEHLGELRVRIFRAILAILICFLFGWYYSRPILAFFLVPIVPLLNGHKPVFLDITEPFLIYMKVALLAGLCYSPIAHSQERAQYLKLIQTIVLPGVEGRFDHMSVDIKGKRLPTGYSAMRTLDRVSLASSCTSQNVLLRSRLDCKVSA